MSKKQCCPKVFSVAAERVTYDEVTGDLFWKRRSDIPTHNQWNTRYAGKSCGTVNNYGYVVVAFTVDGKTVRLLAHRLIWFMHYNEIPKKHIDHINQNPADNRISNLRLVSNAINCRNSKRHPQNTSGFSGVYYKKQTGKWFGQVRVNYKCHHLGYFDCFDKAADAVKKFRKQHGFTDHHGV